MTRKLVATKAYVEQCWNNRSQRETTKLLWFITEEGKEPPVVMEQFGYLTRRDCLAAIAEGKQPATDWRG